MTGLVLRLSAPAALLSGFAISFFFVASLYLWKILGYSDKSRDETGTIQRRFASTVLSCLSSALLIHCLSVPASLPGDGPGLSLPEMLGIQCEDLLMACVVCVSLTAVIFIGPIAQHLVDVKEGNVRVVKLRGTRWMAFRDLLIAPFTEEFVFRACLMRFWLAASFPPKVIIFCSPICFGLAHTHHFIERVRQSGDKRMALLGVFFQVFYTCLFGMYVNFLLLRTGSLLAVCITHSFCNHQGFPDVGFGSAGHSLYAHRHWLGMLYVIGLASFGYLLGPLTEGFHSHFVAPFSV